MYKTLRISFSLKNTYRVNSILFAIKQIPLIRKILPDALYGVRGLKIFANIISVIWEVISVFLGKFLYFITMVCGIGILYKNVPEDQTFLHILLFLTVIGAYMNTSLFNPTRDKYYAMIQLRMNATGIYAGQLRIYDTEGDRGLSAVFASVRNAEGSAGLVLYPDPVCRGRDQGCCGGVFPVGL